MSADDAIATKPEHVSESEHAVRQYLQWLNNPASLVDEELIASLEAQAAAATDPLEQLKIWSRLERARAVDGERFQLGFIRWAKQWANEHEITEAAFRQAGVDDTLLRAAGIGLAGTSGRARHRGASGTGGARHSGDPARFVRSVSAHEIKATVSTWTGDFVQADVATKIGGSPMTVRKAIEELVEEGRVRRVGPIAGHRGPGRAPILFRVE